MHASSHKLLLALASLAIACLPARAQQSGPINTPAAPTAETKQVSAPLRPDAPQVNTVLHRINGIKMLDLLRRKGAKVAPLDDESLMADDMHTNITAGLSLEDGTIVARLPQAELEVPSLLYTMYSTKAAPHTPPQSNLLIVQSNGQQLPATFIGLDGGTGLSLLRIYGLTFAPAQDAKEETLTVGQRVRLLSPARAPQVEGLAPDQFFLNISELEGKLTEIARATSGHVTRLTVSSDKLSQVMVGGIALNEAGETIGMVESSNGNEAYLIPVAAVRRAVNRIRLRLERKPQPWLGARGSSLFATSLEQMMTVGWDRNNASRLMNLREGVVLTSVPPQTPAWFANLRVGDVVTRVNTGEVKSAEDFSSLLKEAGGRTPVSFTVVRPDRPTPQVVKVKLRESLNPVLEMEAAEARAARLQSRDPFVARGLETLFIKPKVAHRLYSRGGLLVTFVHPESAAWRAGLLAGDVIESVDGRLLSETALPAALPAKISLGVIRQAQKMEVKLVADNVKQR